MIGVSDTYTKGIPMSKGSTRVTVRMGDEIIAAIQAQVHALNMRPGANRDWTISEYIIQSVVAKLRHTQRSKGQKGTYSSEKIDEWGPREWVGDEG
jgi:hypothetical protein